MEFKENSEKWKCFFPSSQSLKKIVIKLEIDTNPPLGAKTTFFHLDFPILHQVKLGTLETLFSGKIHALLCQAKGRDWYDLLWYIQKKTSINYELLKNAFFQTGPFSGKALDCVDREFVVSALIRKIHSIDWKVAKQDVERFLKQEELPSLKLWGKDLFIEKVQTL